MAQQQFVNGEIGSAHRAKLNANALDVGSAISINNLLHIQHQTPSGTGGGASLATSYNDRLINTVLTNNITGASVSSPNITLPAGTYYIETYGNCFKVDSHGLELYNNTAASIELVGSTEDANSALGGTSASKASGIITLGAISSLKVRHYTVSASTNGLGFIVGKGTVEVHAEIKIWKVG